MPGLCPSTMAKQNGVSFRARGQESPESQYDIQPKLYPSTMATQYVKGFRARGQQGHKAAFPKWSQPTQPNQPLASFEKLCPTHKKAHTKHAKTMLQPCQSNTGYVCFRVRGPKVDTGWFSLSDTTPQNRFQAVWQSSMG